jgi:peptidoglycan/xylan/chitin deacetylase (PgdA/CDA1 family)
MSPANRNSILLRYYLAQQERYPAILWQGDGSRREIALTFDDGPHPKDTPQVLKMLAKHEICATFFLIGKYVEQYPQLVRQIHQNGHQLGIHGYRHLPFLIERPSALRRQLDWTRNAIAEVCKISPESIDHIRPPYGAFTRRMLARLIDWGYHPVMWNSMPLHWMQSMEWTVRQVMQDAIPGSVIVLHDGHGHGSKVAEIIDVLVPKLKASGFRFVTAENMERMKGHGK